MDIQRISVRVAEHELSYCTCSIFALLVQTLLGALKHGFDPTAMMLSGNGFDTVVPRSTSLVDLHVIVVVSADLL